MRLQLLTRLKSHLMPARLGALALALAGALLALSVPTAGQAQNLFSPAILVNEDAITYYELQQRAQFLRLLAAPGDPDELAREVLIEERLKKQVAQGSEIEINAEDIEAGIAEFAARTELSAAQFVKALADGGVDRETLRDFVRMGILWRQYVSAEFLGHARPTDAEIDRALGQAGKGGIRVLLSEIIIPITPQTTAQAEAVARQISETRGADAFAAAAAQYSAAATRANGGKMNWMSLDDLPAGLQPLFLAMVPGENTAPIPLPNAIAIFRLRGIQESAVPAPRYARIDYARYHIAGGRSPEALAIAQSVRDRADACDDLYGIARDQPAEVLERHSRRPGDIPRDIALELAKLDVGEFSTALTSNQGQTLVLLMLCARTTTQTANTPREEIAQALTQARLEFLSGALLDQLKADALIIER